jgi:hypothetical protein
MSIKVIENYEPPDEGWGIVVGRFRPKPERPEQDDADKTEQQPDEGDSPGDCSL